MNVTTYFGGSRPVLKRNSAEGGSNETCHPVPGGTGYQPVAVGNLPTDRSFIAHAPMLALRPRVQAADLSYFHLFTNLTELNHQSSKILCSLATSVARNYAKLRDITFRTVKIRTSQNTSRTFLNLFTLIA